MRRTAILLSATLFIAPLTAFAMYSSPNLLWQGISFDGNPRSLNGELHAHSEGTYLSAWFKGAMEGKTPQSLKAKLAVTVDVVEGEDAARMRLGLMAYQGMLYAKVISVDGTFDTESFEEVRAVAMKPWAIAPLGNVQQTPTFRAWIVDALRNMGVTATEAEVQDLINHVIDAMFTMTSTRYDGGQAYSLTLSPTAVMDVLHALSQSPIVEGFTGEALAPEEWLDDVQRELTDAVNMHSKVNTNTAGEFLFGKTYVSFMKDGISFVLIATAQHQATPVYLDVPTMTIPLAAVEEIPLLEFMPMLMDVPLPHDVEFPAEEVVPPYPDPREYEVPVPDPIRQPRRWENPSMGTCSAAPGSVEEIALMRKGMCVLPRRSDYRVNDVSGRKALNPRKTKLKNPSYELR